MSLRPFPPALPLVGALLAAVLATGCPASTGVTCGVGTKDENGACVPDVLARCGAGTKLVGTDCLPDTEVVCGPRTIVVDGKCVPAEELVCGPGTEERSGTCEVLDPMRRVTVGESAEPNGSLAGLQRFTLPAIGAAPAVLGGVLGPLNQGQADVDFFVFAGTRLQRIRLVAQGIGAPVIGVVLQSANPEFAFNRYALALDARGGSREIVIPADGDWILLVTDQAQLTGGLPTGAENFTYTIDVTQVPLPAGLAMPETGTAAGRYVDVDHYVVTATAEAPLYDIHFPDDETTPFPGFRALWAVGPDDAVILNEADATDPDWGFLLPIPESIRMVLPPGESRLFVDYVYEVGAGDAPYALGATKVPVANLGSVATPRTDSSVLDDEQGNVYSIDVEGAALLRVDLVLPTGSHLDPLIELRDDSFALVGSASKATFARYLAPAEAGRYYVVVKDRLVRSTDTNLTYDLTASVSQVQVLGPVGVDQTATFDGTLVEETPQWFAVVAGNDARLSVSLVPGALVAARLEIWPPSFKLAIATAGSSTPGTASTVSDLVVQAGGVLLAKVTGDPGAFSIDVEATASSATFEVEPNDTAATATFLPFDEQERAVGVGFMEASSEVDVYKVIVEGTAPRTLAAETKPGVWNGRIDTRLSLLREDGTTITSHDDIGGGNDLSRLSSVVEPGTYLLSIKRWGPYPPHDGTDYLLEVALRP